MMKETNQERNKYVCSSRHGLNKHSPNKMCNIYTLLGSVDERQVGLHLKATCCSQYSSLWKWIWNCLRTKARQSVGHSVNSLNQLFGLCCISSFITRSSVNLHWSRLALYSHLILDGSFIIAPNWLQPFYSIFSNVSKRTSNTAHPVGWKNHNEGFNRVCHQEVQVDASHKLDDWRKMTCDIGMQTKKTKTFCIEAFLIHKNQVKSRLESIIWTRELIGCTRCTMGVICRNS